jgi:hypothetical protein
MSGKKRVSARKLLRAIMTTKEREREREERMANGEREKGHVTATG